MNINTHSDFKEKKNVGVCAFMPIIVCQNFKLNWRREKRSASQVAGSHGQSQDAKGSLYKAVWKCKDKH